QRNVSCYTLRITEVSRPPEYASTTFFTCLAMDACARRAAAARSSFGWCAKNRKPGPPGARRAYSSGAPGTGRGAGASGAGERAQLPVQRIVDGDALRLRAGRLLAAALARQPGPVGEHRRDQRLHPIEVRLPARERARVDREERLPDPRTVAAFGEKRIGLET